MSHCHSYVAELAAVKSLYQEKVLEVDKLKKKLEKCKTSVAKVCSLLVVLF